ncbi:MAG: ketopantoate reductase family protein [Anaerolineales bacterium]|nr:ketopantoate reductase family protein [Anaerolineales bacterium]
MSVPPSPRFLVIGSGAIGTYIGGSLALAGYPVTFLERPAIAQQIAGSGLKLEIAGETHAITQPQVFGSLESALAQANYDIAIFALKSYDTAGFLENISLQQQAHFPTILCLSNGIGNEPAIAAVLGEHKVIAGTVTSAIGRRGPGEIVLEKLRGIGVAAGHPLSNPLAQALQSAGLNAQLFPRPADMKWSKILTNLIGNASAAILDMDTAAVYAHGGLYRLELRQLRETLAVMRAQGIRVVDLPGTPVRLLAFAVQYLPATFSQRLLKKAVGGGRGGKMPSFHIDLHSGRGKSEVDYLNGAVVRAGARYRVPTPVNRALTDILTDLTNQEIPIRHYQQQPEKLLHAIQSS